MNKAQQYINNYLECGMLHYRSALTPMDMTGDFSKDRAFRKELFEHCESSPYWKKGAIGNGTFFGRPVFTNPIHGGIIIDFNKGLAGGICHQY